MRRSAHFALYLERGVLPVPRTYGVARRTNALSATHESVDMDVRRKARRRMTPM